MLVLTRKLREQIFIGDDITITICRLGNNQVRLGIEAPSHVPIVRSELRPKPSQHKPGEIDEV